MICIDLPDGQILNPLFIESIRREKHFWGSNFYVSIKMRSGKSFDIEQLSEASANEWMSRVTTAIDEHAGSANAYEDARSEGRSDGYSDGWSSGQKEGRTDGYNEARNAFWTYDREEYRINEYNLGKADGRQEAEDEAQGRYWEGYDNGRDKALGRVKRSLGKVRDGVFVAASMQWLLTKANLMEVLTSSLDKFVEEMSLRLDPDFDDDD